MLPDLAAQEPQAETGFFDVVVAQVVHDASLAQNSDITFNRRLASLTNGLLGSQAYPASMELIIPRISGELLSWKITSWKVPAYQPST
ncbi:hypothetical protein D3C84_1121340 [compost metagenome]